MCNFGQNLAEIVLISLFCSSYMPLLFGIGGIENVVFTEISFLIICLWKKYFCCEFRLLSLLVIKMQLSLADAVYVIYFYSAATVLF